MSTPIKFYWPVRISDGAYIGQKFGEHLLDYSQFGLKAHNGLDFIAKEGVAIHAACDGYVTYIEDKNPDGSYKGFGKYARIANTDGWTYYAHQLRFNGIPRNVKAGDIIGYVDSTGFSTAAHLHFGFRPLVNDATNGYGGCVDPEPYLAAENDFPSTLMPQVKTQQKGSELRLVLQASSMEEFTSLCKVLGKDPKIIEETVV